VAKGETPFLSPNPHQIGLLVLAGQIYWQMYAAAHAERREVDLPHPPEQTGGMIGNEDMRK